MKTIKINEEEYVSMEDYNALKKKKSPNKTDGMIMEQSRVLAITKLERNDKTNGFICSNGWEYFDKDRADLFMNLNNKDTIKCELNGKFMVRISSELLEQAKKTNKAFRGNNKLDVYIKEKNHPILITDGSDLGFILAPRIESEDE